MLDRLRGVLKLDAIVPVVLIAAALLMTLEPTILGVTITERQIVLAFFGFLASTRSSSEPGGCAG